MNLMDRLTRKFRRWNGIPNLMIYITATMLVVFVLEYALRLPMTHWLYFNRALLFQGQIWRLITFAFLPPSYSLLWILISLYFYYFIGNSLENVWGSGRFTIYYLFGMVGTIIGGLLAGGATNAYLNLSLFFAFAQMFPNHQVMLFFIIPIKVKYLAYLNWFYFILSFLMGNAVTRVSILFSLLNFFLFFGGDLFTAVKNRIRNHRRRKQYRNQFKRDQDFWR